jgi:hypothetical protein
VNILGGDTVLVDPIFLPYTLQVQASAYTYDSYLWENEDGSVTGSANTFDAPALGWYFLTVTNGACEAYDSIMVDNLLTAGMASLNGDLSVYPNPTNGQFHYQLNLVSKSDVRIEMLAADGKVVFTKEYRGTTNVNDSFNGLRLAEGVYYLKVVSGSGTEVRKIVIY